MTWSGGKNPVQLLHEKFKDVTYEFQQEGRAKVFFLSLFNYSCFSLR